jgi:hypothetical protein
MNEVERRPIGESEFGANDGISMATHQVQTWLENDAELAEGFRRHCVAPEDYASRAWHLLYGSFYRTSRGDTRHSLDLVRDSFTRADFDRIDWAFVRESLLAE